MLPELQCIRKHPWLKSKSIRLCHCQTLLRGFEPGFQWVHHSLSQTSRSQVNPTFPLQRIILMWSPLQLLLTLEYLRCFHLLSSPFFQFACITPQLQLTRSPKDCGTGSFINSSCMFFRIHKAVFFGPEEPIERGEKIL